MNSNIKKLYYTKWRGLFILAATESGLAYLSTPNETVEQFFLWADRTFPTANIVKQESALQHYINELDEYAQGSRQIFSFSFETSGTPFQEAVWKALQDIPYGATVTYSAIAEKINKPKAVRAVGTAIGANPLLISIPCHRVVSKSGRGSGYRGGLEMKQALLELERRASEALVYGKEESRKS